MLKVHSLLATLLTLLVCTAAPRLIAEDRLAEPQAATIPQLIEQLGSRDFAKRQTATQRLLKAGQAAVAPLAEAAGGDNREVVTRAVSILRGHLKTGSDKLKKTARTALEAIAKVENGVGPRLAREALAPPKPAVANQPVPQLRGIPQIQIQIQGGAQGIQVRNANGVRDVEVTEQDRKIKIHEDPNKGITVEVTQKKDGKPETKKYAAKNVAELKKNHPDAYKLYEKYAKGAAGLIQIGNIQIQGGNGIPQFKIPPIRIPNFPQPAPQGNLPANIRQRMAKIQLQHAENMIKAIQRQLEAGAPPAKDDPVAKSLENLKRALQELETARKQLEGQGQKPAEQQAPKPKT